MAAAVLAAIGVGAAIYKGRGSKVIEAAENGADSLAKKGQERRICRYIRI